MRRAYFISFAAAFLCVPAHASAKQPASASLPAAHLLVLKPALSIASVPLDSAREAMPPTSSASLLNLNLSLAPNFAYALPAQASTELTKPTARGLPALLARVVPRDAQVKGAQAALAGAQARYRQARSRMLPNLGVQANKGQSSDLDGRLSVARSTQQVEANLRWNLYQGGTDYAEMAASESEIAAAEAELKRAKEEVAARMAEAYSDLLRLMHTKGSAATRLAEVAQLVEQVARQSEAGKLSELDLQQAQNAELDAELASSTLESDYQSALLRLRLLASGELSEELVDFSLAHIQASDSAGNTARNTTLQVVQAKAAAAQLRVRSLTATFAPKIDLNVRQLLNNHTTPPQSTQQQRGWSIGVSWDWPLGGENFARRDETLSRADQAQAEVERAELAARAEFESLTPHIANLQRSLRNLSAQEDKMTQVLRASGIQFEAGRRSLQQIIQGKDGYFNLQQRRQEQQHRLRLAQLRQLALTGQLLEGLGLGF